MMRPPWPGDVFMSETTRHPPARAKSNLQKDHFQSFPGISKTEFQKESHDSISKIEFLNESESISKIQQVFQTILNFSGNLSTSRQQLVLRLEQELEEAQLQRGEEAEEPSAAAQQRDRLRQALAKSCGDL